MKALGWVRNLDNLGRVVIPSEIRTLLGMQPGEPIEMFGTTEGVFIRKYEPRKEIPTDTEIDAVSM